MCISRRDVSAHPGPRPIPGMSQVCGMNIMEMTINFIHSDSYSLEYSFLWMIFPILIHIIDMITYFSALRATAGQGPNYVGPSCGYVGLCWPMLAYIAGNVGPAWVYVGPAWGYVGLSRLCGPILRPMSADLEAYVGPCWPMLSPKIRKMGTAKKHCKTQDILMVGGRSWGYVGPSWGYVGLSWGQRGPILGLCWPILGLCCPVLRLCWSILRPKLAHVDPS